MPESQDLSEKDDRMPITRATLHPCEFERAYVELVMRQETGARPAVRLCSDTATEERIFPASPSGRSYFLCNGHLRDLFEALDRVRPKDTQR